MTDATSYESYIRYPTDLKLLWESVEWLYHHLCRDHRILGIRRPRNKYNDVSRAYLIHSKKRKRKAARTKMLKRQLINLLVKLLHRRILLRKTTWTYV